MCSEVYLQQKETLITSTTVVRRPRRENMVHKIELNYYSMLCEKYLCLHCSSSTLRLQIEVAFMLLQWFISLVFYYGFLFNPANIEKNEINFLERTKPISS